MIMIMRTMMAMMMMTTTMMIMMTTLTIMMTITFSSLLMLAKSGTDHHYFESSGKDVHGEVIKAKAPIRASQPKAQTESAKF